MIHSHARSGDETSRPIGPAEGDAPCTRRRGHLTRWWARPLGGSTQLTRPLEVGSAPAFNVRMEAVIVVIGRAVTAVAVAAAIALAATDAAALFLVVATLLPVYANSNQAGRTLSIYARLRPWVGRHWRPLLS